MRIVFSRRFEKQVAKLPKKIRDKVYVALELFAVDQHDRSLRNHELTGQYAHHRSIDVTGDVRAVYFTVEKGTARFIAVGTHSQLYG